jgi:hypothetical protein
MFGCLPHYHTYVSSVTYVSEVWQTSLVVANLVAHGKNLLAVYDRWDKNLRKCGGCNQTIAELV